MSPKSPKPIAASVPGAGASAAVPLTTSDATTPTSEPEKPPVIDEVDIKLLWGRSGNRCAFPKCPHELTMDNSVGEASAVGVMAHIVGEVHSTRSPRGISTLTLAERNSYANLILLCNHHHTVIDKKRNIRDYPVERLHQMKEEHEARVRDTLARRGPAESLAPHELVYADVVDRCTKHFFLDQWGWYSDNAVRQILPLRIDDAQTVITRLLLGTNWPGRYSALEKAVQAAAKSFVAFVEHHRTGSRLIGGFYKPDKSYKKLGDHNAIGAGQEKSERWHQVSLLLFQRHVCDVNVYAAEVRRRVNPLYFLRDGQFLLIDSLGVWDAKMEATIWKPSRRHINAAFAKLGHTS